MIKVSQVPKMLVHSIVILNEVNRGRRGIVILNEVKDLVQPRWALPSNIGLAKLK